MSKVQALKEQKEAERVRELGERAERGALAAAEQAAARARAERAAAEVTLVIPSRPLGMVLRAVTRPPDGLPPPAGGGAAGGGVHSGEAAGNTNAGRGGGLLHGDGTAAAASLRLRAGGVEQVEVVVVEPAPNLNPHRVPEGQVPLLLLEYPFTYLPLTACRRGRYLFHY